MSDLRKLNPKLYNHVEMYTKRATLDSEAAVKRLIKRILSKTKAKVWMPPARAYGSSGISDFHILREGRFVALEAKYGGNTPTENQDQFGADIEESGGVYVVVDEKNVTDRMFSTIRWLETGKWDGPRKL